MSSDGKNGKEKRTRRRGAGVRKHQIIENVVVEETFTLASSNGAADRGKAGDGVYVSATVAGTKRFYGVMIEQPALKEASALWLQDQADSLELNRRIRVLKQQQEVVTSEVHTPAALAELPVPNAEADGSEKNDQENHQSADVTAGPSSESFVAGEASKDGAEGSASSSQGLAPPPAGDDKVTAVDASLPATQDTSEQHCSGIEHTAKRALETGSERQNKKLRTEESVGASTNGHTTPGARSTPQKAKSKEPPQLLTSNDRPVQKFKYVMGTTANDPGYRVLVATFANVEEAASGDREQARSIEVACEEGGNYLPGNTAYYYQYEVLPTVLSSSDNQHAEFDLRTSMGLHTFLHDTPLPPWFPLSNLQVRQGKVLDLLNIKKDNLGNLKWDGIAPDAISSVDGTAASLAGGTKISMQPRPKKRYQIGVIGGGIAGVACCQELVTLLNDAGLDYHITLFEARPRLGGRLWTDQSFHNIGGEPFPIELGASWIHGIDDNPLAAVAEEAGIDFVTASEEVQMLGKGMRRIDSKMDEKSGKLFDGLLDLAADECWSALETAVKTELDGNEDPQAAVRWYSSVFVDSTPGSIRGPHRVGAPAHRLSSDRSIDVELGKVILNHKMGDFAKLSADEHRMLMWNLKNVEYALGANIADLSMKFWDADEGHAFEGDHVLLKQGYSKVIDHMLESIKGAAANDFELLLDFPVGQVEYARKTTTLPYGRDRFGRSQKMAELSDSCSVTSQDGGKTKFFDFVVCACPLGVLKESISSGEDSRDTLSFQPPLPFSKVDAIANVGFGLLDKVYLKFPRPFWRQEGVFKEGDECLFGNVSGVHPHHYMFFDIGRCLGSGDDAPAILMSLVSGKEAVACECLSDKELVDEVMTALRTIFSNESVPEPTAFRFTRWGQDKYCRGSYTFLPPGATDQDFHLLQSPVNGNGDSLLLEGSEIMRLFFAGEHTTALHPSMAHGAMLSGLRAAKEIVKTIQLKADEEKDIDRIIPVALYRHMNPTTDLRCNMCHKVGGQIREGSLLAFKRGARQVLVHNNCAEYSPEVEVMDSKWKNVIRAVNRGKSLNCTLCRQGGATIGCTAENCYRVFHFSCSEDAGWRFERDGKIFFCDLHRKQSNDYTISCDRISMDFYRTKNPASSSLFCRLCGTFETDSNVGQLLAFQFGRRHALVHENCIKYTSICDTAEIEDSRMRHEYKNVFVAIDEAKVCAACSVGGATIRCSRGGCEKVFHLPCAEDQNWDFSKRGQNFRCTDHRKKAKDDPYDQKAEQPVTVQKSSSEVASFFNHNLLAQFGAVPTTKEKVTLPGNLDMGGIESLSKAESSAQAEESDGDYDSDESTAEVHQLELEETMDTPLSSDLEKATHTVTVKRGSNTEPWGLALSVVFRGGKQFLTIVATTTNGSDGPREHDVVVSIDGQAIGQGPLSTLRGVTSHCLKENTELVLEVVRTQH